MGFSMEHVVFARGKNWIFAGQMWNLWILGWKIWVLSNLINDDAADSEKLVLSDNDGDLINWNGIQIDANNNGKTNQ